MLAGLSYSRSGEALVTDFVNAQFGFTRIIVDLIILTLYIGLPTFFLTMLAWGGEGRAQAANASTTQQGGQGAAAGGKGAGLAVSGGKAAYKKATK